MRVLQLNKVSSGFPWALRQMRELQRIGVEVHVALPPGSRQVADYEAAGIAVHPVQSSLPIHRPYRIPGVLREFRALVERVQPDIIHSHFVGTTLTMRLALGPRSPIPRVYQVAGPLHLEHPFFRVAEIRTAGPPDRWIGNCRWIVDRYRRSGVAADRVTLSYLALDIDEFRDHPTGKLRAELGVDSAVPIVGMVAYMYPPKRYLGQRRGLKGHEDLIDALVLARESSPDLLGVFVGGVWNNAYGYERRIRAYAAERLGDAARFLGTRGDIAELYPDFDVAVHPSHSEALGGANESMLTGIPTVATNVGGFPDIVIPGETGWLVPPKSPHDLAAAVLDVLGDREEAHRRARNGKALARQMLDIHRNVHDITGVYERALREPSGDVKQGEVP